MSKLIVIFLLARLRRKGKCSTRGGGGGGGGYKKKQPIFFQLCSHMLFFTYLTKHMMMSFFVFTMFCIEKRSLFPPQLKILTLTFIIIIQH